MQEIPRDGLARLSQIVPNVIPVSKATWWAGVKTGRFPRPVKFGGPGSATFWRWADVHALLDQREG